MTPSSDAGTVAKAAGVNLLGMAARSSRSLVTLFVTRVGGAGTFGIFTLVIAVTEVVSRLTILGMDKSLLKFLPEKKSPYAILSASFRTALVLGVVASLYPAWRAVRIKPLEALRR